MPCPDHKPRDLRRRVLLPARLRGNAGWSDACILNISSRGLLIRAAQVPAAGSTIELRHGEHAITARVVWREGPRVGLCADGRLPVDQLLLLSETPALRLAPERRRRREPRHDVRHERSRLAGRLFEFIGVAAVAVVLTSAATALVSRSLGRPLAQVGAVLDPQPASALSR